MKFSAIKNDGKQQKIIGPDIDTKEYDRILWESKEVWAANRGLGPYIGFGLSDVQGRLTMAIG